MRSSNEVVVARLLAVPVQGVEEVAVGGMTVEVAMPLGGRALCLGEFAGLNPEHLADDDVG